MRIYVTSDTHNSIKFPEFLDDGSFDAMFHCGDYTNKGFLGSIDDLKKLNYLHSIKTKIIHIPGNHDLGVGYNNFFGINALDQIIEFGGHKILGLSLSPCYDMPFLYHINENVVMDREVEKNYYLSKPYADIILSHCPPANCGILDITRDGRSIGSKYLYEYILTNKPKYVFCGHRHTEDTLEYYLHESGTYIYNVATQYKIFNL